MNRPASLWLSLALPCAGILAGPCAAAIAQGNPTVSDGDTAVSIEAGAAAPRLMTLALRGGATWENQAPEPLPAAVVVAGAAVPLDWQLDRQSSHADSREVRLIYHAHPIPLDAQWVWQARATQGPLEHTITIRNLGTQPVELALIDSLRFDFSVAADTPLTRFWVEKSGDHPSEAGVHADPFRDGDTWQGTSSTYARPIEGKPLEMIPYVLVHRSDGDLAGWYLGIEFSSRTRIAVERAGAAVRGKAGLDPEPGPYRTRVPAGGSFVTPTVFLGAARGGADGAGNALRRWVRATLQSPRTLADPAYPLLVSNSWGSGLAVDAGLAQRMIDDAKSLGLELYHLDAGWFRSVGDWQPDPVKFPHGVAAVADYAHQKGMKFGLWVDWTQAGTGTGPGALRVDDPVRRDWLVADPPLGWKPAEGFKGITVDIGVPAVQAWAAAETERIVRDNHLDMLEHDGYLVAQGSSRDGHPAVGPEPGTLRIYEDSGYLWADGSNDTDVSYHAVRAYYAIQQQLRERHPGLILEVCNDGGRMVDFGSAAHGDYFSITDHYDPLSNRRAFHDASFVLPAAMLEAYVEHWPTPQLANFRYMLRSGMMGWFSLMLDTGPWTRAERAAARAEFALYKSALRPLIRGADLYHVGARPDGVHWDGVEYYSAAQHRGVLYAFRGAAENEPVHRFRLAGLDPEKRYRVVFHDRGPAATVVRSGTALLQDGLEVRLDEPLSSELAFITPLP